MKKIKLSVQKSQKHYGEIIPIEIDVPDEQLKWVVRKFVVRVLVQNIDNLSVLWKRNLNQDGEDILRCRVHCFYKHIYHETAGCPSYSIESIPKETKVSELRSDIPIEVTLLSRSRLCKNPRLHPIPRIKK